MSRRISLAAALAFVVLGGSMTAGCVATHQPHVQTEDEKQLAAWQQRMVRPCAKSGDRVIC